MSNYDPISRSDRQMRRMRESQHEADALRAHRDRLMKENAKLRLLFAGVEGFIDSYMAEFCRGIDTDEEYPEDE